MTTQKLQQLLADLDIRALPPVRQVRVETGVFGELDIGGPMARTVSLAEWRTKLENVATDLIKGTLLQIIYTDAAFAVSDRRIRILTLQRNDGMYYLYAWCLEREEPRHFRIDRIDEVVELGTGEVFDNGADWLNSLQIVARSVPMGQRQLAPAVMGDALQFWHLVRDAAVVLMFAARCDGKVHREEQAVVAEFVQGALAVVAPQATDADIQACVHMALCLCADSDMMLESVENIHNPENSEAIANLWRGVEQMITSDGKRTPQEHRFKAELKELLS